ncbi:MAG: YchJ family protein [Acidimicrobiales bacterium]
MASIAPCHCGTGLAYDNCCGPVHLHGAGLGTRAVELMRARYSAYVEGNERFLLGSWHPDTRPATLDFDPTVAWTGLTILDEVAGGALDNEGIVEFAARYRSGDTPRVLRERSAFRRHGGNWLYVGAD